MAVAAHGQQISDEEYARQLQQEEFRSVLPGPFNFGLNRSSNHSNEPSRDISAPLLSDNNHAAASNPLLNDNGNANGVANGGGPNGGNVDGNAAQRARRNVISHVRDTDADSPRILLFRITLALLEVVLTSCFLAIGWDEGESSDCTYLKYWVLIYTARQFVIIPLRIHIFRVHRRSSNEENNAENAQRDRAAAEKSTQIQRWLQIMSFLLFLLGQTFLFTEKACQDVAPHIWYYCLAIIILVYVSLALPFLIVLAICICLPCVLIIFRFFAEPEGADDRAIKNLPTEIWKQEEAASDAKEDDESEGPSCAICMQEYKENDELRVLPCRHKFHTQCVDKWLPMKKICPLCRHDVTKSSPGCPPAGPLLNASNANANEAARANDENV